MREGLLSEKDELIIEDVLKEVVSRSMDQIKAANASIKTDFSECHMVSYPKSHLKTILQKLLSNSLKYRDPEKPLVIKVKTRIINGHVTIIFNDNGLGFDALKHRDEIVKPYVRVHAHVEGTGLGLYLVKTILDYHKGGIRIESEPKKGATFALRLN